MRHYAINPDTFLTFSTENYVSSRFHINRVKKKYFQSDSCIRGQVCLHCQERGSACEECVDLKHLMYLSAQEDFTEF